VVFPSGCSSNNGSFALNINDAGVYTQGKNATDEQRQVNLIDNLFWSKDNHQLKFGLDFRWLSPFTSPYAYRQQAQFSGVTCPAMPPCPGYAISGTSVYAATFSGKATQ